MTKKVVWILLVLLSVVIGLYPTIYFLTDRNFGLLSSKSNEALTSIYWNIGFYVHIVFGGLALLIGWVQFNSKIRNKNLKLHRQIGKIYIISVFLSSSAGFYISLFATGGLITSLGLRFLHDPFAIVGRSFVFTSRHSIQTPMDEHTEPGIAPLIHTGIFFNGLCYYSWEIKQQ